MGGISSGSSMRMEDFQDFLATRLPPKRIIRARKKRIVRVVLRALFSLQVHLCFDDACTARVG